jgi:hypothetical protein
MLDHLRFGLPEFGFSVLILLLANRNNSLRGVSAAPRRVFQEFFNFLSILTPA